MIPIFFSFQNCASDLESAKTLCQGSSDHCDSTSDSASTDPEPNLPSACRFDDEDVAHGNSITAYKDSVAASCQTEVRNCNDGELSGSFEYASCTTILSTPKTCLFNGINVAHGTNVTSYLASNVEIGESCMSQSRTCNDGVLSGSGAYSLCKVSSVVNNSAELKAALTLARGGETLFLSNNSKYDIRMTNIKPASKVLITSLDSSNPSTIETWSLTNCQNLHLDKLTFNSAGAIREDYLYDVAFSKCTDIALTNSRLSSVATKYDDGTVTVGENGVLLEASQRILFSDNEISNYRFALRIFNTDFVQVKRSHFHHNQADGIQSSNAQDILIEDSSFTEFLGSLQSRNHTDLIQFYTSSSPRQIKNITIRNNYFDNRGESWSQVIFLGNEAVRDQGAGREMYYKNILIENNLIHNNTFQGITLYYPDSAIIRNNAAFMNKDSKHTEFYTTGIYIQVPRNAYDTVVENNIANIFVCSTGTQTSNNVAINLTNSSDPLYITKHFENATAGAASTAASFKIKTTSSLATRNVGPPSIQP